MDAEKEGARENLACIKLVMMQIRYLCQTLQCKHRLCSKIRAQEAVSEMQRNQAVAEKLRCLTQQWDIISKMLSLLHCLISKSVEFNHSCWLGGTGTQKQDVFLGPDLLLHQGPVQCSKTHSTCFSRRVMEFSFFPSLSSALRLRHNQRFGLLDHAHCSCIVCSSESEPFL